MHVLCSVGIILLDLTIHASFCLTTVCSSTSVLDIFSTLSQHRLISTSLFSDLCHLLGTGWDPFAALNRAYAFEVHRVNLFQSTSLTFNQEEIHDESTEKVASGKNISVLKVDSRGDERGEESDQEIPEPNVNQRDSRK